jgi:hypothetical protein
MHEYIHLYIHTNKQTHKNVSYNNITWSAAKYRTIASRGARGKSVSQATLTATEAAMEQ